MAQEITTLGGGCFWCTEAIYDQLKGVTDVVSGYSGTPKTQVIARYVMG